MTEEEFENIKIGDFSEEHPAGNDECAECWMGYPIKCNSKHCAGLIHATFGDENWDGDYWLYTKCDKCGESE